MSQNNETSNNVIYNITRGWKIIIITRATQVEYNSVEEYLLVFQTGHVIGFDT